MNWEYLLKLLDDYKAGRVGRDDALSVLKKLPYEDLDFAKVDHHRALRNGFPEVIFCQGKTVEQVVKIFHCLSEKNRNILATRAGREVFQAVAEIIPGVQYNEAARTIYFYAGDLKMSGRRVFVLSAGTADIPVAEEAAVVAKVLGHEVEKIYDVGVAGIHRLLDYYHRLNDADVIIVVAGMEGALASVVAGLVDVPVIAVPTSVGYGAHLNGLATLLAMLNSCASGIGVVNIDNGFGAATLADAIIRSGMKGDRRFGSDMGKV